jgi:hypothetical protein
MDAASAPDPAQEAAGHRVPGDARPPAPVHRRLVHYFCRLMRSGRRPGPSPPANFAAAERRPSQATGWFRALQRVFRSGDSREPDAVFEENRKALAGQRRSRGAHAGGDQKRKVLSILHIESGPRCGHSLPPGELEEDRASHDTPVPTRGTWGTREAGVDSGPSFAPSPTSRWGNFCGAVALVGEEPGRGWSPACRVRGGPGEGAGLTEANG